MEPTYEELQALVAQTLAIQCEYCLVLPGQLCIKPNRTQSKNFHKVRAQEGVDRFTFMGGISG